jgi:hypothetical protein
MTKSQLRHQANVARFNSGKQKPPTRKQAQAWLLPIRKAMIELQTGHVDAYKGYAITRIHWSDDDFARIDYCINGFVCLIDRLCPEISTEPMKRISKKLANGVLLVPSEIDSALVLLKQVENRLIDFRRDVLIDAANTEITRIEFERLGLIAA